MLPTVPTTTGKRYPPSPRLYDIASPTIVGPRVKSVLTIVLVTTTTKSYPM